MNTFRKLLSGFIALSMLAACSDDISRVEEENTHPYQEGDDFFMGLDIQLPGGIYSRSQTITGGGSNGGEEIGLDFENNVTTALIVLASKEDKAHNLNKFGYIASSLVQTNRIKNESEGQLKQYSTTARLQKTNLDDFYEEFIDADGNNFYADTKEGPEVYVFVFCNPTTDLVEILANSQSNDTAWINSTCEVIQGRAGYQDVNVGIWGENSFLMNNAQLATRALPPNLTMWERFNTSDNPYHLSDQNIISDKLTIYNNDNGSNSRGPIRVERSVARFDFRDGSKNDNTYPVLYYTDLQGNIQDDMPIINVKMQKMCLVNMSNSFYYVPRVSDNGQLYTTGYAVCGNERPWNRDALTGQYSNGNYVVGPYANIFNKVVSTGFRDYFNFPFFENDGSFNNTIAGADRWDVVMIDDVLKGQDDQYDQGGYTPGDYKIWRYVTENVIPGSRTNQRNGVSTGIVFKARMLGNADAAAGKYNVDEEAWNAGVTENIARCLNDQSFIYEQKSHPAGSLTGSSKSDPIFYYINGSLYMGFPHLRQAAIQSAVTINSVGNMEINRSGTLYKAVFGDGPIPGNNLYIIVNEDNKITGQQNVVDPEWTPDAPGWTSSAAYLAYVNSADYAFQQWYDAGRPVNEIGDATTPPLLENFRKVVTGNGVAIFQSSVDDNFGPGYYCYYYYWNRHNDNGRNGVMGPMEFDVVRNNVYKISVDKVSHLGHPRIPTNDPENPTPNDPDESDLIYLDVKVTVLPWTTRINNVHF